ncbi:MAG: polysaccharide biosynthesis/export family protein [bacterium]
MKKTRLFLISAAILAALILTVSFCYAQESDYKIGPEDVLQISVWGNEQLTREVVVRPDGKISYPLLGDLKVSGLCPMEVKEIISSTLIDYVSNPEVTVIVQDINNYKVYITGSVSSPGVFSLKRRTNLLQLLIMAGGLELAKQANLAKAYILRKGERLAVDFEKLISEGDMENNIDLLPEDIIYIPDNFSSRITVVGEVITPNTIPFRKGITILDAVLMAGGPTGDADLNDTKLVRMKNGHEKKLKVALKDIMKKGQLENNVNLEPGDTIIIPASIF